MEQKKLTEKQDPATLARQRDLKHCKKDPRSIQWELTKSAMDRWEHDQNQKLLDPDQDHNKINDQENSRMSYNREERLISWKIKDLKDKQRCAEKRYYTLDMMITVLKQKLNSN